LLFFWLCFSVRFGNFWVNLNGNVFHDKLQVN
jgi:hypothetical protein